MPITQIVPAVKPIPEKKPAILPQLQNPQQPVQLTGDAVAPKPVNEIGIPGATGTGITPQVPIASAPPPAPIAPPDPTFQNLQTTAAQNAQQAITAPQVGQQTTQDLLTQKTNQLLQDPSQGFDSGLIKQQGLEGFSRQAAQGQEAQRQQLAGIADAGQAQQQLLRQQLMTDAQRQDLSRQFDIDAQQKKQADVMASLGQGRETATTQSGIRGQEFTNLATAAGIAEPALQREFQGEQSGMDRALATSLKVMDIQGQQALTTLKNQLDQGTMMLAQDWEGAQNELGRNLQLAIQNNDIQAQQSIVQMQADLQEAAAANEREWMSTESGAERFSREQIAYAGLDQQERQMAQQSQQFESELDWNQQAFNLGLDADQAARVWQAGETDKQLAHATDLAQMSINQDQWKQTRIEDLTKAGWDQDTASQMAGFQHQSSMAALDRALTSEVESGRIALADRELVQNALQFDNQLDWERETAQLNINKDQRDKIWQSREAAKDRALSETNASLDRQLQKEVEQGKMTIAQHTLAQQASQFDDQIEWEREATKLGIDQQTASQAWQSSEAAEDRAHQSQMRALDEAFSQKNIDLQAFMATLGDMGAGQKAEVIKTLGAQAGIPTEILNPNETQKAEFAAFEATETADQILAGTLDYKTIKGTDDPVYKALLESPQIEDFSDVNLDNYTDRENAFGQYQREPRGAGNDSMRFRILDEVRDSGGVIKIGDTVWRVKSITNQDKAGTDETEYVLSDIGNASNTKTYTAY